jgi:hypothetical protein
MTRPQPSEAAPYYSKLCVEAAKATDVSWQNLVEDFRSVRSATLAFFANIPPTVWSNTGIAGDNSFTVRALAYIVAGHVKTSWE